MKQKIFVVMSSCSERSLNAVKKLCFMTEKYDTQILVKEKNRILFGECVINNISFIAQVNGPLLRECKFILSVGGDGTFLEAAFYGALADIPVAGINTGTIGFLAKIPEKIPEDVIENLIHGEYPVQKRMTLDAKWEHGKVETAFNDITLARIDNGHMCTFHIYCDDEMVASWRADGIVVYTPTGSTAYAYSAGGSAVDLNVRVIGIIPICPQNGRNNGLICSAERRISITTSGNFVRINADGKSVGYLHKGEKMILTKGEKEIQVLEINKRWGIDELNRTLNHLEE